jgi:hypothetical protein
MLDALIDRQDGHVAGPPQPSVVDERLKAREHAHRSIRHAVNALNRIWTGEVEGLLRNGFALMLEELRGVGSQDLFDVRAHLLDRHISSPALD